jgi:hypothetical protein
LAGGSKIEKDLLDPCLLIVKEIIDVPSDVSFDRWDDAVNESRNPGMALPV